MPSASPYFRPDMTGQELTRKVNKAKLPLESFELTLTDGLKIDFKAMSSYRLFPDGPGSKGKGGDTKRPAPGGLTQGNEEELKALRPSKRSKSLEKEKMIESSPRLLNHLDLARLGPL